MAQSINLIPTQEVHEQKKTVAVKFSTIFSIILLILVAGVSAYFFYTTSDLKGQIKALDSDIEASRTKIKGMANVEINARNLDKKYKALSDVFSDRIYYSTLISELYSRQPSDVELEIMDVRTPSINVTGTARSYLSVASYWNNLLGKELEGSEYKNLFTKVKLNSVTLQSSDNEVRFTLSVEFDPNLVRQKE